jgi:hypothetical protein
MGSYSILDLLLGKKRKKKIDLKDARSKPKFEFLKPP